MEESRISGQLRLTIYFQSFNLFLNRFFKYFLRFPSLSILNPHSRIAPSSLKSNATRLTRYFARLYLRIGWRGGRREDWSRRKGGPRILSEQLNDYRKICCRSATIPKDGRVSTPPCELFNSSGTKFYLPPSPAYVISFCSWTTTRCYCLCDSMKQNVKNKLSV